MNFKLETKSGDYTLRFSNYFLDRVGKISGRSLSETTQYIVGEFIGNESVRGGMLDDLEVRATVIAAGIDAFNLSNGNLTKTTAVEGFGILEKVPNAIANPVWAEMFLEVVKALMPEKLGEQKAVPVKKAAKKTSR